jgi:hypothetical protein
VQVSPYGPFEPAANNSSALPQETLVELFTGPGFASLQVVSPLEIFIMHTVDLL